MRVALAVVLAIALVSTGANAEALGPAAQAPKCNLILYASLDLTTQPNGLITVPVKVNGHEVAFAVDTGGAFGGIVEPLATSLNLRREPPPFGFRLLSYTKGEEAHIVGMDTFEVGRLVAKSAPIPVMPAAELPTGVSGLLAGNMLHNYDVELDFQNHKLNLFSPEHCPGKVVYWADSWAQVPIKIDETWHIKIPVTVDGQVMHAIVDTGATETATTVERVEDLFGWHDTSTFEARSNGRFRHQFQSLKFEGVEVRNPVIDLLPKSAVAPGAPELLLGMNVLRHLHLYIAYKEGQLYLTSVEAQSAN